MGSPAGFRFRIAGRTPPVEASALFGGSVRLGKRGSLRGSDGTSFSGAPRCSVSGPATCPARVAVNTVAVRIVIRKVIVNRAPLILLSRFPPGFTDGSGPAIPGETFRVLEEAEHDWAVDDEAT